MILVTGATGSQGGATARNLLSRGRRVRALVRDPDSPAAKALAAAGAAIAVGDMTDRASLDAAMSGVDGVFSVQPVGPNETEMGRTVADAAAAAAGIDHIVYTSVAGVERFPELPGWNAKLGIENHLRTLGMPITFLRPVKFMENFRSTLDHSGQIGELWNPDKRTQVIAVDDIGWFAAAAFTDPDTYAGREWEIAGDELSHNQMAAAISTALGRPITYKRDSAEEFAGKRGLSVDVIRRAAEVMETNSWQADITSLRVLHPGLMDFDTWLTRVGKAIFNTHTAS